MTREQEMMYFKIGGTVAAVQTWEIHQSSSSQDCDLYLRFGKYPTSESYSYSDTSLNKDFEIEVEYPETGEFYGGVYGFSACDFSITVSTPEETIEGCGVASSPCSGHGECVDSECECFDGFSGSLCQIEVREVSPNIVEEGSLQGEGYVVFSYVADESWDQIDWIIEERGGKCFVMWFDPEDDYSHYRVENLIFNQTKVVPGETYLLSIDGC